MGINFGDMPTSTAPASIQEVPTADGGITLNLNKDAILNITKENPGLNKVTLGAGWDVATGGAAFDLDIAAFMLNENDKITSGSDVIFFNNKEAMGIKLNKDNRTGVGEGDDETIDIDLSAIPSQYNKIVFAVIIYDAMSKRQTFGMVNNAYVRLLNKEDNDKEICHVRLKDECGSSTAVIFAELHRNGSNWDFKAIKEGKVADLNGLAAIYS